jgi:hypothetical protein
MVGSRFGWDFHTGIARGEPKSSVGSTNNPMPRPWVDGFLKQRGLLDDTLVVFADGSLVGTSFAAGHIQRATSAGTITVGPSACGWRGRRAVKGGTDPYGENGRFGTIIAKDHRFFFQFFLFLTKKFFFFFFFFLHIPRTEGHYHCERSASITPRLTFAHRP